MSAAVVGSAVVGGGAVAPIVITTTAPPLPGVKLAEAVSRAVGGPEPQLIAPSFATSGGSGGGDVRLEDVPLRARSISDDSRRAGSGPTKKPSLLRSYPSYQPTVFFGSKIDSYMAPDDYRPWNDPNKSHVLPMKRGAPAGDVTNFISMHDKHRADLIAGYRQANVNLDTCWGRFRNGIHAKELAVWEGLSDLQAWAYTTNFTSCSVPTHAEMELRAEREAEESEVEPTWWDWFTTTECDPFFDGVDWLFSEAIGKKFLCGFLVNSWSDKLVRAAWSTTPAEANWAWIFGPISSFCFALFLKLGSILWTIVCRFIFNCIGKFLKVLLKFIYLTLWVIFPFFLWQGVCVGFIYGVLCGGYWREINANKAEIAALKRDNARMRAEHGEAGAGNPLSSGASSSRSPRSADSSPVAPNRRSRKSKESNGGLFSAVVPVTGTTAAQPPTGAVPTVPPPGAS